MARLRADLGLDFFQNEPHGAFVQDLDRLDVAEEVVGEGILAELGGRMLGVDLPLDRELHRLGVERGAVVVPGLAESWTISKDGLAYTFKLRNRRVHPDQR
jgi:ABC-type transport system substrate-binding protein